MPTTSPTVPVEAALLQELLVRRDELVRAITAGTATGEWDQVMEPFDRLLVALRRLEESLEASEQQAT